MDAFVPATVVTFGVGYYARPGMILLAVTWLSTYAFLYTVVPTTRSALQARRTGFPIVFVPWHPHSFVWMVLQHPLRPYLKRWLPQWLWNRISITIYGWEFHERYRPFDEYAAPQGDRKSFVAVSFHKTAELFTWDSEVASQILSRPRDFVVEDILAVFMDRFGKNILTSSGDAWARQRKVVASVINEKISRSTFNETIRQTEGLIDEVTGGREEAASTNRIFDMMKRITIHVLSGVGMGESVTWDDDRGEKPRPGYRMNYMNSCKMVTHAMGGPIILPDWFLAYYPSFAPGAGFLHQLGHAIREYPQHTRHKLDEEQQRIDKNKDGEGRGNIMSQMLRVLKGGPDVKGPSLSEDELVGNLFIFTIAGFDTTANTLNYAMMLLCRYPKWQDWLLEEVDALLPNGEISSAELDYTEIHPRATRVLAFMFEVLRHFPPLIHLVKQAKGDQSIQTSKGTYLIPDGCGIYIDSVALHFDGDVYRNVNIKAENGDIPSDDDELKFRPSRWINPKSAATTMFQPPKGAFIPWSMGPRSCPGMKMAQVEFVAVLLTLLRQHRVEATPLAGETREQVEQRLDAQMRNSISKVTLEMLGVYDVTEGDQGFKLSVKKRR